MACADRICKLKSKLLSAYYPCSFGSVLRPVTIDGFDPSTCTVLTFAGLHVLVKQACMPHEHVERYNVYVKQLTYTEGHI